MRHRHLLLIETDPAASSRYELFLGSRGYQVTGESSAAGALRAALLRAPDVLVIGRVGSAAEIALLAVRLRATAPAAVMVAMSETIGELPGVDVMVPYGLAPRALLDAIRTGNRRRAAQAGSDERATPSTGRPASWSRTSITDFKTMNSGPSSSRGMVWGQVGSGSSSTPVT
jgi:DNA-binding response OmpR family regulator